MIKIYLHLNIRITHNILSATKGIQLICKSKQLLIFVDKRIKNMIIILPAYVELNTAYSLNISHKLYTVRPRDLLFSFPGAEQHLGGFCVIVKYLYQYGDKRA